MKQNHFGLRFFIILLAAVVTIACGAMQSLNPDSYLVATQGAKLDLQTAVAATLAAISTQAEKAVNKPTDAAQAPTQASTAKKPADTQTPSLQPNAYSNGISFIYDPTLSKAVKARVVDATGPESDQQPLFAVNPHEDLFEFQGYAIDSQIKAQLVFFAVKEYEALEVGGAASGPVVQRVDNLKKLLSVRPRDVSGNLPDLPIGNASMVIHSQLQYLKLQNGSGMRFLTQYAQDVSPISNDRLLYVFQGITSDGAYYISGQFPVTHPSLPANYEEAMKGQDSQKFSENFTNYLADVQNKLNAQKSDSFKPTLNMLDAMMTTIKIDK